MNKVLQEFKKVVGCTNKNSKISNEEKSTYLVPASKSLKHKLIDEKDEDEGFDLSSSVVKMQEKDRFRLFKQSKKDSKCVKKQASVDSNYFSDPEVHVYEEIDDNHDLINTDTDNGSKNNLYLDSLTYENVGNVTMLQKTKNLKNESEKSKYDRLRKQLFQKKENIEPPHSYHELEKSREKHLKKDEKILLLDNYDDDENEEDDIVFEQDQRFKTVKARFSNSNLNKVFNGIKQTGQTSTNNSEGFYSKFVDKLTLKRKIGNIETNSEEGEAKKRQFTNLTDIKPLSLFQNQSDAILWYLNLLLCDTMLFKVKDNKTFTSQELSSRVNMVNAHAKYVKNLYEVRIASSIQLKQLISSIHPCIIALALLNDSDALCVCESHSCEYDSYIYLFSTKIKCCSYKAKYYIVLKKPKQSSFDRLNLIEGLINCQKLIQDKNIF